MNKEQLIEYCLNMTLLWKTAGEKEVKNYKEIKKLQRIIEADVDVALKLQFLQLKERQRQLENQNTRLRQKLARIHEDSGEIIE